MVKNTVFYILLFYILVLLQTSFLVHFSVWGYIPNLILISVILFNIFQKPEDYGGLAASVIGGFFLDIFSSRFFGFWILILLATTLVIKFIFKRYVWFPLIQRG